jgi:hypothetical protein
LEAWTASALRDGDPRTVRARRPLPCCQLSWPGRGHSGRGTRAIQGRMCPSLPSVPRYALVRARGPRYAVLPQRGRTRPGDGGRTGSPVDLTRGTRACHDLRRSCCSQHSSARPCLRPAQPAAAIMACGHTPHRLVQARGKIRNRVLSTELGWASVGSVVWPAWPDRRPEQSQRQVQHRPR